MIAMGLSSSNCIFVCTVVCSISLLGSTSCFPVRSKRTSRWSWSGNYFVVPLTRHACNSSRTLTRTLRGYHMDYVLRRVLRCELHSDPIRSNPIQNAKRPPLATRPEVCLLLLCALIPLQFRCPVIMLTWSDVHVLEHVLAHVLPVRTRATPDICSSQCRVRVHRDTSTAQCTPNTVLCGIREH